MTTALLGVTAIAVLVGFLKSICTNKLKEIYTQSFKYNHCNQ
jgi:hypothetical protein